jgi:hypothetical protein
VLGLASQEGANGIQRSSSRVAALVPPEPIRPSTIRLLYQKKEPDSGPLALECGSLLPLLRRELARDSMTQLGTGGA